MRAFITGVTGFTGSRLALRLHALGHSVSGLDVSEGAAAEELRRSGIEVHGGSVTDRALVERLVAGCDRVYHLAAAFRKVNLPRQEYHAVNVEGTRNVLEAALAAGVGRVLHCSTCGVHGDIEHPPANEDAPIRPADYYQQTKWEGEQVARELGGRGLWVTIVRPGAIYGPGDRQRFAMLFRLASRGRFLLLGDGSTQYHPVYISDLVEGMIKAVETDAARGRAYLLANKTSVSLRDLVVKVGQAIGTPVRFVRLPFWPVYAAAAACELVFKPLPAEPPLFRRRVDWFRQNRSFDIARARRELGWEPAVDLDQGLALAAEWYRAERLVA